VTPLQAYGLTDKGRVRPTNEDCFAIHEELGLCVVADGMGGHNAGEVAARLAVDAVVDFVRARAEVRPRSDQGQTLVGAGSDLGQTWVRPGSDLRQVVDLWPFGFDPSLSEDGNLLRTAVHLAHIQIREAAISSHDCAGMGTTIVAARVAGGRLSVAHVGDSRLYVMAGGGLRQVTQDDSWMAAMLADDPHANPLLLEHHPMRNALTNVVGARARTEVHVAEEALVGGELLLLSTDGVHGVLDGRRIERLMVEDENPRAIAHGLVRAALTRGSRDNCTAVVARYLPAG
jgi:serine/threonine protein phosphatase PrpC